MRSSQTQTKRSRCFPASAILLVTLTVLAVVVVLATPPRSDPPSYFDFADQRTLLSVPRLMDVISSFPWAAIGLAGLWFAWCRRPGPHGPFTEPWERVGSMVLFTAILGISAGSAYFHYKPGPGTLLWDRLPMAVAFMSFFALMIGDRMSLRWGRVLFWPLVAFAILSVCHWRYTEVLGRGDIRLYALVQFFPMLAIPFLLIAFPARYTRAGGVWLALLFYSAAKLLEINDAPVFALTRTISGHTLKHLAAAIAALLLLWVIRRRRQVRDSRALQVSPEQGETL